jgi:hypothetical protein
LPVTSGRGELENASQGEVGGGFTTHVPSSEFPPLLLRTSRKAHNASRINRTITPLVQFLKTDLA